MPNKVLVSSAEFIRNVGFWQGEALRRPVTITHHGRERLVLASLDEFLKSGEPDSAVAHANEALRAAHVALLENLDEGYLAFSAQLRIVDSNRVAEAFLGHSQEGLVDLPNTDIFPRLLSSALLDNLQRVLRTRKAESLELEDAGGRWLGVCVFPMQSGVGLVFTNTTEQHQLRQNLEEARALSSALALYEGVISLRLDQRGRVAEVSQRFETWTGFAASEVTGFRFVDLITANSRRQVNAVLDAALGERRAGAARLQLVGKAGQEIDANIALSPIKADFAPRGAMALLFCAANDHARANSVEQKAEGGRRLD